MVWDDEDETYSILVNASAIKWSQLLFRYFLEHDNQSHEDKNGAY